MISVRISEHHETGHLTAKPEPPQTTGEQADTHLLTELSPESFLQIEIQDFLAEDDQIESPQQRIIHPLFVFLSFFWGPIPWAIESSAVLSAVARRWEVAGIILVLLLVEATLGFWQEYQGSSIVVTFKEMLP